MYVTSRGPSASTPASPPPRSPTPSTGATSRPGRWACRSPSTSPPTAATTPTTRGSRGDVGMAGRGDRLDPTTCARCSTASRSTRCAVSMTMNGAVLPVLALYIVAGRGAGRAARAAQPGPSRTTSSKSSWSATPTSTRPTPSMRIISDIFALHLASRCRSFNSISISGYHMQEAGATAGPRARLHAGRRRRVRPRRPRRRARHRQVRAAAVSFFWAIGMNFFMEVAKMRARGRLLGAAGARSSTRQNPESLCAAHPLADLRLVADRAGRLQQRGAAPASRRWPRPGAHPVAAHQRARRGARAADRLLAPGSPATRSCCCSRRAGTTGTIDRGAARTTSSGSRHDLRRAGLGAHPGGRAGRRHGRRRSRAGIPEAARSRRPAARTQARIDSGAPGR